MAAPSNVPPRDATSSPGQVKAMANRTPEWSAKWTSFHEAYMQTWHSNLKEAADLLADTWRTNLWSAIGITEVGLWEYNFGESKQTKKELEMRMDLLEKISDSKVDKNKPSFFGPGPSEKQLAAYIEGLVGLAYSYMARAILHFRRQNPVKGGYNTRKAWVTLKDAFEALQQQEKAKFAQDEEISGSIYFGIGFFNFLVSLVPPSLQFIVKLLGFEGDRTAALGQLTRARESRCCKRIEATLCLFALRRYFTDDEEAADPLLEEMLEDYPDSPMVLFACALLFRFKSQTDRSLQLLKHAVEMASHEQMRQTLNYHLGTTYVMTAQYEPALVHHTSFLQNSTGEQFKVWSSWQSGICQWMLTGDRALVSPHFQFVLDKGKSDIPLDKMAMRKAREYFKAGETFTPFTVALTRIQHIHEGQLWSFVLEEVKKARPLARTNEEKAAIDYYRASASQQLKLHDKARKYYTRVLNAESQIKSDNYTYIVPYTYAELGETELLLGNLPRAKEFLKKAKKYEDYDWNNLLSVRISASMDKLARREYAAKHAPAATATPPAAAPSTAAE
jgi:tetratricopeptide (TPR) repeat protein